MCNQEESQLMAQTEVLNSQNNLLAHANAHLERLKRTNIHNDAFHIWHDGPFGTINGLRLGRLPGHPVCIIFTCLCIYIVDIQVEWMEINAAWGQAALLLKILADTIQLDFQMLFDPILIVAINPSLLHV